MEGFLKLILNFFAELIMNNTKLLIVLSVLIIITFLIVLL